MRSKPLLGASEPVDAMLYNLLARSSTSASTDPPSNPARGDSWFKTDTMELVVYYGATTGWAKPWNVPWGDIAQGTDATVYTITTAADAVSVSFNAVQNRVYELKGFVIVSSTVANDQVDVWLDVGGSIVVGTYMRLALPIAGAFASVVAVGKFTAAATASTTVKVRGQRASGTGTVTTRGSFAASEVSVIDIGQAGSAPAS